MRSAITRTPSITALFWDAVVVGFHSMITTCSQVFGMPNRLTPAAYPAEKTVKMAAQTSAMRIFVFMESSVWISIANSRLPKCSLADFGEGSGFRFGNTDRRAGNETGNGRGRDARDRNRPIQGRVSYTPQP